MGTKKLLGETLFKKPAVGQYLSPIPALENIIIDNEVKNQAIVINTLNNLKRFSEYKNTEIKYLKNSSNTLKNENHSLKNETLYFLNNKGSFLEKCPGSDGVLCCHYFIINTGINCSYDCQYCFLQSYANISYISIYANTDKLLSEIKNKTDKLKNVHWRIGTGEYTDSLALDHLTELTKTLVPFFSKIQNATLELKTKSAMIQNLLELDPKESTVVSWSLNPEELISQIEQGTASLPQRISAAKKVSENGYDVGFHFDPLIWYDGWEKGYKDIIHNLLDSIPENKIRWISMGTFRYSKNFKEILKKKNPFEKLTTPEMFCADDGKYRYFAPQRKRMYELIKNTIHEINPQLFLYLCMETKDMWERIFSKQPESCKEIDECFEKRRLLVKKEASG